MAYNDNKSYDFDFWPRMNWLCELMEKFPDKPMRKLQREAMHMYPIGFIELQRYWLSSRLAFKAADYFYETWIKRNEEPRKPVCSLDGQGQVPEPGSS